MKRNSFGKEIVLLLVMISTMIVLYAIDTKNSYIEIYNNGVSLLEYGKFDEAVDTFSEIPEYIDYKDIRELLDKYGIDNVCPECGHVLE